MFNTILYNINYRIYCIKYNKYVKYKTMEQKFSDFLSSSILIF